MENRRTVGARKGRPKIDIRMQDKWRVWEREVEGQEGQRNCSLIHSLTHATTAIYSFQSFNAGKDRSKQNRSRTQIWQWFHCGFLSLIPELGLYILVLAPVTLVSSLTAFALGNTFVFNFKGICSVRGPLLALMDPSFHLFHCTPPSGSCLPITHPIKCHLLEVKVSSYNGLYVPC